MSDQNLPQLFPNSQQDCSPTFNRPRSGPAGPRAVDSRAQARISCAPLLAKGFDTIHLSLSLDVPETVLAELREAKANVQQGQDLSCLWKFGQTNLFSWELSRTGVKLFPYVLRQGDLTLCLSTRASDSSIPNASLSIGSLSSNNNPFDLLSMFKKWLSLHGIHIRKEVVSRVDLYADFEVPIQKQHLASQGRMITRAVKVANFFVNRALSGVQVGTSSIVLRCYDKLLEMQEKQATTKQEFFINLWGKSPVDVTRVEYQLRRDALREFFKSSCTFAELSSRVPELWAYLTSSWFRLTARPVDRKNRHQDREVTSPFWVAVQSAFNLFSPVALRKKRLKVFNLKALVQQAGGIMATIAAGLGIPFEDLPEMLLLMQQTIGVRLQEILDLRGKKDFYRRGAAAALTF